MLMAFFDLFSLYAESMRKAGYGWRKTNINPTPDSKIKTAFWGRIKPRKRSGKKINGEKWNRKKQRGKTEAKI